MEANRFILASRSPRRQELLKLVIPDFTVIPSRFDEQQLMEQGLPSKPVSYTHLDVYKRQEQGLSGRIP